jgi:ribose/xylose/arabinose/galactoside ABC-type transport system permease subunit
MESTGISKYTISFGLSLAITSVVNALLVVLKEKNQGVMDKMKQITGHHWITHSAFTVLLFIALGLIFAQLNGARGAQMTANRLITTLLAGVVVGGGVILGFYLIGD